MGQDGTDVHLIAFGAELSQLSPIPGQYGTTFRGKWDTTLNLTWPVKYHSLQFNTDSRPTGSMFKPDRTANG